MTIKIKFYDRVNKLPVHNSMKFSLKVITVQVMVNICTIQNMDNLSALRNGFGVTHLANTVPIQNVSEGDKLG